MDDRGNRFLLEPISDSQMNDVCSATEADARRFRAQMGWSPSGANQRRRCRRAAQILRTEAIRSLGGVPSGPQGFQPGKSRRALLKPLMALCIVIIEFEIGSNILVNNNDLR